MPAIKLQRDMISIEFEKQVKNDSLCNGPMTR